MVRPSEINWANFAYVENKEAEYSFKGGYLKVVRLSGEGRWMAVEQSNEDEHYNIEPHLSATENI
jgi:hypothetical protein